MRLQKALYGLMRADLLFYWKLRKELEEYGFVINPEDPCVANKWIVDEAHPEGHQMMVILHVDDLLVSCKDTFELTKLQCYLGSIYGPGLAINRGREHHYLGMHLKFCSDGSLKVGMVDYVKDVINDFPEDVGRKSYKTPAASHLFQVREEIDKKVLPEEQAVQFHHTVAQLLFLSARARRDIQTAVAFLTTRVKQPNEDDWGKLRRVIWYLNGTRNMVLKLTIEDLAISSGG